MYAIRSNEKKPIYIRPMKRGDVRMLVELHDCSEQQRQELRKEWSTLIADWVEEESVSYFFTIMKGDKIIGSIVARAITDCCWNAVVLVRLQKSYKDIRSKVERLFVKMCQEFWLYDNIYFIPTDKKVTLEGIPEVSFPVLPAVLKEVQSFQKFEIVKERKKG